jgi:uncharacterized protein (TIGR03437 family)
MKSVNRFLSVLLACGLGFTTAAAQIVSTRPRVILTPAVVTKLKAKALAGDPAWVAIKTQADTLVRTSVAPYTRTGGTGIIYDYLGLGWLLAIQPLGMAFHVTGNTAYCDKVIEIMNAATAAHAAGSIEAITADSGFASRAAAFGMALGYDWCYSRLTDAQKTAVNNMVNAWFDWVKASAFQRSGPAFGNYFGGHMLGFGAVAYATFPDNPRALEIASHWEGLFNSVVVPAFTTGPLSGGHPVESFNYGPNHHMRLLEYAGIVKSATGRDIGGTDMARRMARNLLYNLKPNRWQTTDEGDYPGDFRGILQSKYPALLTTFLGGGTEAAWMQFMFNNLAPPPTGAQIQNSVPYDKLLYEEAGRPVADFRSTEPLFFRSPGDEHIYVRSSWNDDAVWGSFAAGGFNNGSHESRKAGHVSIQRGDDYLLINSGQWKGLSGICCTPTSFDLSSFKHSTLFVNDLGEYMHVGDAYNGGQGYWGTNRVLAHQEGPDFVVATSEFTDAYDKIPGTRSATRRSVQSYARSFAYVQPGLFIVYDKVRMLKTTYIKKQYFHFNPNGRPTISGKVATSHVGSSTLYLNSLFPPTSALAVADNPVSPRDATPITPRVEVSDTATSTEFNPLTVLYAAARGTPMPPTDLVTSAADNMLGAIVRETLVHVVLFSKDGSAQNRVTYTAVYPASDLGRHILADMAPGSYSVTRDGTLIQTGLTPSGSGVLTFDAIGGRVFEVTSGAPTTRTIALAAGSGQTGAVGTTLPVALQAKVTDSSSGAAVSGVTVNFTVVGGSATLSAASATTDASGIAQVTVRLGSVIGPVAVEANASGVGGGPIRFNLTAVAGAPAGFTIVSGTGQTGVISSVLARPFVVKLADSFGNGIQGQVVNFAVTGGGGTLSRTSVTTDVNGLASSTLTLGPATGINTVTARTSALGSVTLTFTATATGGAASSIAISGGNLQTAPISAVLPLPLEVLVTDIGGNPVAGASVTWTVVSGGATLTTAATLPTNPSGRATVGVRLGSAPGPASIRATVAGVATAVTFTATGVAGGPVGVTKISGDTQSGVVGSRLAPMVVRILDTAGNPVSGVSITFAISSGGGLITPAQPVLTDPTGHASSTLTLPSTPGTVTISVTGAGVPGSATFTATATGAAASSLSLISGNAQSGPVGRALPLPLVVRVRDALGNPVSGFAVTFAVSAGGGSVAPVSPTTNAAGDAQTTWTLGTTAGPNGVTATAGTLTGSPATFTATGVPLAASSMTIVSGDVQSGVVATTAAAPLVVELKDSAGNPVPGIAVTYTVTGGSATITTLMPAVTDSAGKATAAFRYGNTAGPISITVSASGVTSRIFSAVATPGPPASLTKTAGDAQSGVVGTVLTIPLTVTARDTLGNLTAGREVTFAVTTGSATVAAARSTTDATGRASTILRLGATPGPVSVSANLSALSVTFSATAIASTPTLRRIVAVGGIGQSGIVDTVLPAPLMVQVTDASGTPLTGVAITFAKVSGDGSIVDPQPVTTDGLGVAFARFRLGRSAGENQVSVTLAGAAGSPVLFGLIGSPGPARTITKSSGDSQTALPSSVFAVPLGVVIKDEFGNAKQGVALGVNTTAGSGTILTPSPTTDSSGQAFFYVQAGTIPGPLTIAVTAAGIVTPATFSLTVAGDTTTRLSIASGDGQQGAAGTRLAMPLVVRVADGTGAGLAGQRIDFSATPGEITFDSDTAVLTDSGGQASASVTLGPNAETVMVTATLASLRSTVVFRVTIVPGPAAALRIQEGDNQNGTAGQALPRAIEVLVADRFGNPVSGAEVQFVAGGAGTFTPATVRSDSRGVARTIFTLAATAAGALEVRANLAGTSVSEPIRINAQGVPFVTGIVNPASFTDPNPSNPQLASNSLFTIFGTALASSAQSARSLPLPTLLENTAVNIGGQPTPLLYVSPTQINAVAPPALELMPAVDVEVVRDGVRSARTFYRLVAATPGLFTTNQQGSGPVTALLNAVYTPVSPLAPAPRGASVLIFATGLGEVRNTPPVGQPAPVDPLATSVLVPVVTIGGVEVPVAYSGLAPGFVGLFQINVTITDEVPTGPAVPITVTIGGQVSNTASVAIRP